MSVWPLKKYVIKPGEGYWGEPDRFGNEKWIEGEDTEIPVLGWEVVRSTEGDPDSVLRTIDELQIIAPPGTFTPEDEITLPNQEKWQIEGNPLDSTNGPWWNPGLVIYRAKKVTG